MFGARHRVIGLATLACAVLIGCMAHAAEPIENLKHVIRERYFAGQGRETIPLARHYVEEAKRQFGENHLEAAASKGWLALLYESEGRYLEAEELYRQSLKTIETVIGPETMDAAIALNNLAGVQARQSDTQEAIALLRRAIAIYEKLAPDSLELAQSINNLGTNLGEEGRLAESEAQLRRALQIRQQQSPTDDIGIAESLNNIGSLLLHHGKLQDGYDHIYAAQKIYHSKLPRYASNFAAGLSNLAYAARLMQRKDEAHTLYRQALAATEKALGRQHPEYADGLLNLAHILNERGEHAEAEKLERRALAIVQRKYLPNSPRLISVYASLSVTQFLQGKMRDAMSAMDRAAQLREQIEPFSREEQPSGISHSTTGPFYAQYVMQAYDSHADADRSLQMAQRAELSLASSALSQMVARHATGDQLYARMLRARQDAARRRTVAEQQLLAAIAANDAKETDAARVSLAGAEGEVSSLDSQIASENPRFASYAAPKPLNVADVQFALQDDEALVQFLIHDVPTHALLPAASFVWIITKTDIRWAKLALSPAEIRDRVAALRCGLDGDEWLAIERSKRCGTLLGIDPRQVGERLPFSSHIAHDLYVQLFGAMEDILRGKQLLIVPSGPLAALPFSVLLTRKELDDIPRSYADYRGLSWLVRQHAITMLPSISVLRALRRTGESRNAEGAYLGIGNPKLEGDKTCPQSVTTDSCPASTLADRTAIASSFVKRSARPHRSPGLADVAPDVRDPASIAKAVNALCSLPDSAYELDCVARGLNTASKKLVLGGDATEDGVKKLNAGGALEQFSIVHFATHGLVSGDIKHQIEPALVLTPPREPANNLDDGLFTASEISELKLDADWVVLSACNTAAGDASNAEALSGLARAFFYAGARSLLVSHWSVYSDAAVLLSLRTLTAENALSNQAISLQRAMISLIDDDRGDDNAHPSVWAPFVLVGAGQSFRRK